MGLSGLGQQVLERRSGRGLMTHALIAIDLQLLVISLDGLVGCPDRGDGHRGSLGSCSALPTLAASSWMIALSMDSSVPSRKNRHDDDNDHLKCARVK